ncbi:pyridoxal-phosphate dependent enzyme [Dermacoccus abyssi]|uniref:pyridoxal-phosphate dependent enzyme n=1 Tax=Dermacoccus abyssi TaxID=322596 RepID=UPI002AD5B2A1|nr:pyridoxal-phosphate dependent enzyme [Dermacoccus abyssi]
MTSYDANAEGFFGEFGGRFVPPHLEEPMAEVARAWAEAKADPTFLGEYERLLTLYAGRPSVLFPADNLTRHVGGARIYLKREDLNHTGSHKINHCLGEALLAKRMGKKKLIAETGAGQHGVALATAAAYMGLECEIHMGAIDVAKQHPNVVRMEMLGAKVVPVEFGGRSLKEAVDSAFDTYARDFEDVFFGIGSVVGPDPYPSMVREFQSVVGREAREARSCRSRAVCRTPRSRASVEGRMRWACSAASSTTRASRSTASSRPARASRCPAVTLRR